MLFCGFYKTNKMDVVLAIKMYVTKMIEESGKGMKILLMDDETTGIVSMVFAQSEILQKEVYLFEKLTNRNNVTMKHMKAIVFVRPTDENIQLISQELRYPKYGEYYIYFSHVISKCDLKSIAECDEHECVKDVNEYYADYYPISPQLFTLNLSKVAKGHTWDSRSLMRTCHGLSSVLLSLKKCPVIRYQQNSSLAKQLAESVKLLITKEASLFDFRRSDVAPILLITDRSDDCVSPLLNQWTYQAMVHELLGIYNSRVDLSNIVGVSKELSEVVLSPLQDSFYEQNQYKNFGEIGQSIKVLMEEYQANSKKHQKVESIQDMKSFVENYPQFKKMSGTVSKHVTVVGELSRIVAEHNLLQISECEQDLVAQNDHSGALQTIRQLLSDPRTKDLDALRLVALYALRFESHPNNATMSLVDTLSSRPKMSHSKKLISSLLKYGGASQRCNMLFGTKDAISFTKNFFKGLQGVENVYTQHTPLIADLIDQLSKNKLRESDYPYLGNASMRDRAQDIVIFIVGGATYEEAACVQSINAKNLGIRIVLGSNTIFNTSSFLEEVLHTVQHQKLIHNSDESRW